MDSQLIDQIVAEVLDTLRQRVNGTPKPSGETANKEQPRQELTEIVITEDVLKQHVQPGTVVHISPKAIITPSARDYLRSSNLQLLPKLETTSTPSTAQEQPGILLASHLPGVVQSVLADVRKNFSSAWSIELESGVQPVIERARSIICRSEAPQVVVFVSQAQTAACYINRTKPCRAVVVSSGDDVQAARLELGANVICVNLHQQSYMNLRAILQASRNSVCEIQDPNEN